MAGECVTFERKRIDPHRVYGVIVGESDDLVMVHQIADFQFDGWIVLRKRDITADVPDDGTGKFQIQIMKKEGLLEKTPLSIKKLPLDSWKNLLGRFEGKVIILENEKAKVFYLGPVLEVGEKAVVIDNIDGLANSLGKERILYSKITLMQFGDRYSTLYNKYRKL